MNINDNHVQISNLDIVRIEKWQGGLTLIGKSGGQTLYLLYDDIDALNRLSQKAAEGAVRLQDLLRPEDDHEGGGG